eukprot:CAMPEP_0204559280 /NCGR_PEP_ID=MMETSP0661-20131031/31801_1 /ASSEMBLY_ACC=CAM_ASM_000606 /TAXON_ID=109239 /ORGANISM="Alexandrium margalefi, Strain AMGDE01CS-322" /LENGTH=39 /DNA_ID= /DNA_START= /DNA_END= /DNA_ORIENTATION=
MVQEPGEAEDRDGEPQRAQGEHNGEYILLPSGRYVNQSK